MPTVREKIIPKNNNSKEMPSGLYIKYMVEGFGDEKEITEDGLEQLIREIHKNRHLLVSEL